jgi:hypothetical protein
MSIYDRVLNAGTVVAWRTERLVEAGLPEEMAHDVAADGAYDLHALLVLIDRGCPADLAVRIVAPVERRGPAC